MPVESRLEKRSAFLPLTAYRDYSQRREVTVGNAEPAVVFSDLQAARSKPEQLSQNVRQDATVIQVIDLDWRIDA